MKTSTLFFFVFLIISACSKENNAIPELNQEVLFQFEFANYAWIPEHGGFLIDSSGNVRNFNMPENWHYADSNGWISENDMKENLLNSQSTSLTINKDTLIYYYTMIWKASKGEISKPRQVANDKGSTTISGFIYDNGTKKYKEIVIRQFGDIEVENNSQAASGIYNWLINLYSQRK